MRGHAHLRQLQVRRGGMPRGRLRNTPTRMTSGAWVRMGSRLSNRLASTFATTGRALRARPHSYLTENRLEWWYAIPPNAGPIAFDAALGGDEIFDREFSSSFACVAGGGLDSLDAVEVIARRATWDQPRVFTERTPDPRQLVIAVEPIRLAHSARQTDEVLTVRARGVGGMGRVLAIDFSTPQRAVGLEAGFGAEGDDGLDAERFTLRAWRRDGSTIDADGAALLEGDWFPHQIRRIGVRDRRGDIVRVEFRCDNPVLPSDAFLFVLRVWSETLPPAVVTQGILFSGNADDLARHMPAGHPDLGIRPAGDAFFPGANNTSIGAHPARLDVTLPLGCTNAAVFIRGFKWLLGGVHGGVAPAKLKEISIGATVSVSGNEDPRRATLILSGGAVYGEQGEFALADYVLFFTLLAWNPERTDVTESPVVGAATHVSDVVVEASGPNLATSSASGHKPDFSASMLFAGAMSFRWRFSRPIEAQRLAAALGLVGGKLPQGKPVVSARPNALLALLVLPALSPNFSPLGTIQIIGVSLPPLGYLPDTGTISLFHAVDVGDSLDADETMDSVLVATVLNGAGVQVARLRDPTVFYVTEQAPRGAASEPFKRDTVSMDAPGDMAVPILGAWVAEPYDELLSLDMEVRGERCDAVSLDTRIGGGIDLDGTGTSKQVHFGLPYSAGIVAAFPVPRLSLQIRTAEFDWYSGLLTMRPRITGAIRNDGNMPVQLNEFTVTGAAADFFIDVAVGPVVRSVFELLAEPSLVLLPGEELTIGGRFFTSDSATPGATRRAQLQAHVSTPGSPSVVVELVATSRPQNAIAEMVPTVISFGNVRAVPRFSSTQALPVLRSLLISSSGTTPVQIRRLSIEFGMQARPHPDVPGIGIFSLPPDPSAVGPGSAYQLDPGTSIGIQLMWRPHTTGRLLCWLVADTNIGRLETTVVGWAVGQWG